jgi:asparagine synthase (glutamine-hydrolysing)
MSDENQKIWIIFNGEIYNYLTIRSELQTLGCQFKTNTDTEVLLQAYKIWGENCLEKLDGMWAFSILDLNRNCLFASVDRTGVKPFYYHLDQNGFCFASEIKGLKDFGINFSENEEMVSRFLVYGQSDETDQTMFEGISRLKAGHFLLLDLAKPEPEIKRYHQWKINQTYDFQPHISERERIATIRELLHEMIKLRLQSDVPLGICLSGGIDSSTIAGLTSFADKISHSKGHRKAFMATLPEGSLQDESGWARMMASQAGFDFFNTQPKASQFVESFQNLIYTLDEPPPGLNAFSQYQVFKLASSEGIKVTLDGQGADEIFAGYPRHHESNLAEGLVHFTIPQDSISYGIEAGKNYIRSKFSNEKATQILLGKKPEFSILNSDVFRLAGSKNNFFASINKGLLNEFEQSSLPFLLKAADRNSMRWSIESRMPFADFSPLVDYLFQLPGSAKIQKGYTKYLLRRAASGLVPQEILNRRDKVGFAAPNHQWLSALIRNQNLWENLDTRFIDQDLLSRYCKKFIQNPLSVDFQLLWRAIGYLGWRKVMLQSDKF